MKWHGGKSYLAKKLIALFPPHLHYVEPFAGGLAVLLARNPDGVSEVVNDLNSDLVNFWRVLQCPDKFDQFRRRVEAIPLSRELWTEARDSLASRSGNAVDRAVWFFVLCRQSRAGACQSFTPLTRSRTRRGVNGNVSEWLSAVDGLPDVHQRLRQVVVENRPALELIEREDTPGTLFYCDPPYLHSTRTAKQVYAHEMTERDHLDLLAVLKGCKGKVMISGYLSDLYDRELAGWNRHTFDLPNHASGTKKKGREVEVVWCNF